LAAQRRAAAVCAKGRSAQVGVGERLAEVVITVGFLEGRTSHTWRGDDRYRDCATGVNPQHLLQSQWLATLSGFRVVRLDQADQPRPLNDRIHLGQEPLATGHFVPPIPRYRSERLLIPHPRTSTAIDPTNGLIPQPKYLCRDSLVLL
jgi:hypothetical protein